MRLWATVPVPARLTRNRTAKATAAAIRFAARSAPVQATARVSEAVLVRLIHVIRSIRPGHRTVLSIQGA